MSYFIRRGGISLISVVGVATFAFLLIHIAPGDPVRLILGDVAVDEQTLQEIRQSIGLDRPLHVQYLRYLKGILSLDLGKSYHTGRRVIDDVRSALPFTIQLTGGGLFLATLLGVPAGVFAALRRDTIADYVMSSSSVLFFAAPSFWVGILLIYSFSYRLGWFPIFGAGNPSDWGSLIKHLGLPAFAIGSRSAALISRITRSSMLEVLGSDYVRTARSKGLHENRVVYKHALRNAAIPIATILGLDVATLLGGAVITETVFARPGLGKLAVDAIYGRDYPVVQGVIIIFALIVLVVNLFVDLAYSALDPRIRYS